VNVVPASWIAVPTASDAIGGAGTSGRSNVR
jgi:hypothetical protein